MGSPLGSYLARAIQNLRVELAAETAPIAIVTPSSANGSFIRRQLALQGGFVNVSFWTPELIARGLGAPKLVDDGLQPEPPGWLSATTAALLRQGAESRQLGPFSDVLADRGWRTTVARAVTTLEEASVIPNLLARLGGDEGACHAAK